MLLSYISKQMGNICVSNFLFKSTRRIKFTKKAACYMSIAAK